MPHSDFKATNSILNGGISVVSAYDNCILPYGENEVHTHYDRLEIYYFLEGDLYFAFEGKQIPIENGSMIIIDCGTLHRPIIKTKCKYLRKRILINKEILYQLNTAEYNFYPLLHKKQILILDNETVQNTGCDKLFEEIENSVSKNTPYDNFCALVSVYSLLIKAEKNSKEHSISGDISGSEKIAQILEHINQNLQSELNYKSISQKFFISDKSLYKIFKNETGFTLSNYIKERRIIKAISLLNSGYSANETALEVGFNDYSVFYRSFTKKVGLTPNEYIKKQNK